MNGFKSATVRTAKLVTMPNSASRMAEARRPNRLGKRCVRLQSKEALSGMLRKQGGHGPRLRSGCKKYGRCFASTFASLRIRSRLSKVQDTKRVSRSVADLHFTRSHFSPA